MSKRQTNYSVGRKHCEFPWQHWTQPLNTDRRSSRLPREWVKVAVFVISLVPRSTGGFRSFVYSVNMDSVYIDMYTRVFLHLYVCATRLYVGTDITYVPRHQPLRTYTVIRSERCWRRQIFPFSTFYTRRE